MTFPSDEESNYVNVGVVEVKHDTPDALLIIYNDEELWVPRSQVNKTRTQVSERGHTGELWVTKWYAKKKGIG